MTNTTDTTECPSCDGAGSAYGIICGPSGSQSGRFMCSRCRGEGKISNAHAWAIVRGEQMRQERLENKRSLSEQARRLGISKSALSDLEYGRILG